MLNPFTILVVIALLLSVCSLIWNQYPILPVAVLLICVALLIGGHPFIARP